jgi:hypothetical protein
MRLYGYQIILIIEKLKVVVSKSCTEQLSQSKLWLIYRAVGEQRGFHKICTKKFVVIGKAKKEVHGYSRLRKGSRRTKNLLDVRPFYTIG